MMFTRGLLLTAALILASCSSPAQPSPTSDPGIAARLVGSWVEQGLVTGSTLTMQLGANGQSLSGTGRYAIEAGRSGTVTLKGDVINGNVHIALAYDYGQQAQFDGTLVDDRTLSGAMHIGPPQSLTPAFQVTFTRG